MVDFKLILEAKRKYLELKKSGILLKFDPELTGNWHKDFSKFIKKYKENLNG